MDYEKEYHLLKHKFDLLVDLSNDGYWEWEIGNEDYEYYSPRFKEILRDPDMPNKPSSWKEIIDPKDLETATKNIELHLKDPVKYPYYQVVKYNPKKGDPIHVICRAGSLKDKNGTPKYFIGTHTDITKFKNLEEELEKERDRALLAENATKIFLANMSHEIRTPMNGIVAFAEIMAQDTTLSEKYQKYLMYIKKSSDVLLKLLGDILEYSKLEVLNLSINNVSVDISTKKDLVYEMWKKKFKEKGLKFNFYISKKFPKKIVIDQERYLQVLNNLVSNAYKYTDSGKVYVKVYEKNNMLITKIKDTGIGIPKECYDKLFIPFSRIDDSKAEGFGLGLSICSKIVEKLGGKLWFKSKKGIGSEFYFSYPLVESKNEVNDSYLRRQSICVPTQEINILVVDDNRINQIVVCEILKLFDNVVYDVVSSGEEAIQIVDKKKYDIIFMDIVMPGIHGEEATKIIKEKHDIYVVAMTANSISGDRERYLKTMDDYISKPVGIKDIKKLLKKII